MLSATTRFIDHRAGQSYVKCEKHWCVDDLRGCPGRIRQHPNRTALMPSAPFPHRNIRKLMRDSHFAASSGPGAALTQWSRSTSPFARWRLEFSAGDHLNAVLPRSIATPRYLGAAKLTPKVDAQLEPWTMLGHLAARNRIGRLRLGVGRDRRRPAQSGGHRAGGRDTAPAHPRTSDPGHRHRRAGRQRTLRGGLVQAGGTLRRSHRHHPRAVGLRR